MSTQRILEILVVIVWIIFIGLCIEAGTSLVSFLMNLFKSDLIKWKYIPRTELYPQLNTFTMAFLNIWTAVLKAYLFYWVIKALSIINIDKPFSSTIDKYIHKMSGVALWIGILGIIMQGYAKTLMKSGIELSVYTSGQEYLFFAAILYVIGQIYRRGIELQSENELTI
jgi:hypothetical protein